jgi:hypothetical protein
MARLARTLAAAILAICAAQPSFADCVDSISKDGSHAPLETGEAAQAQPGPAVGTTTNSNDPAPPPQKDGGKIPMAESPDIATSGQDAQSQQKGDKTAAATANEKKC